MNRETLRRWLIVPEAHVALMDWRFQAELYAMFHRGPVSRWGHILCSPVIVAGTIGALSHASAGLGWAVTGAQLAYFAALTPRIGGLAIAPVVAIGIAGNLLAGLPLFVLLGAVGLASAVQALSHMAEPIPPPWGANDDWEAPASFFRRQDAAGLARAVALGTVAVALEFWAAFRVLGLQWHGMALAAGLWDDDRAWLRARRQEIVDNWRTCWGDARRAEHEAAA